MATEMPAEQVRQQVAEILRPQCAHLSEPEFIALVHSVADSKVAQAIVRSTPPQGIWASSLDLPPFSESDVMGETTRMIAEQA